jgi:hypothetical protein
VIVVVTEAVLVVVILLVMLDASLEVLAVEDDGIAEELVAVEPADELSLIVEVELVTSEVVELVDVRGALTDAVVEGSDEEEISREVDADVVDVDVSMVSDVEVNAVEVAVLEAAIELVEVVEVTSVVPEDDVF